MHKKGRFIVLEGIEGAGKSSAIHQIKKILLENKIEVVTTREPGGTLIGEEIRALIKEHRADEVLNPKSELLLFYAARIQLIEQIIKPALNRGCWVLADRFELSSFAYQGGGRKLDLQFIQQLSQFCLNDFFADLTIFLDILPENGLQRVRKRGKLDRIEQESVHFFANVAKTYLDQLKQVKKDTDVIIINANQQLSIVQNTIRSELEKYLSKYATTPIN